MKYLISLFCAVSLLLVPEQNQSPLELTYLAQTRGFKYLMEIKNDSLYKNAESNYHAIALNEQQKIQIQKLISSIDFSEIEDNLELERLAVDAVIKGNFKLMSNSNKYSFEFDHQKLPGPIAQLFETIENID